jgi:demethylmenaquinone methyltransferase/2-methoxy-6-polyprenyl-1,4-benzoquinol methylase
VPFDKPLRPPVWHDGHVQSNSAFYDRISRAYDLIADHDEHEAREAGERALGLEGGERVLEIGVGTGNSAVNLGKQVGDGGRIIGIDVSRGMLDVARRKLEEASVTDRVELRIADARELPFEADSFDAAFASFTLELFAEEEIPVVLAQIKRVLRPAGKLGVVAMTEVKDRDHPSLLERAYVWMHRHFPHIVDCRPIDVSGVIRDAGFEITSEERLSIWSLPVSVVVARRGS